jgi:hypothetical protein
MVAAYQAPRRSTIPLGKRDSAISVRRLNAAESGL